MPNKPTIKMWVESLRTHSAGRLYAVCMAIACILSAVSLNAQMDQGTITGIVMDTTGAVIPGADVTLTSIDTGLVLHTKSGGTGEFVFSPIKIGNYKLSAGAQGMQTTTRQNIRVDIQQRLSIDLKLQPGSTSETVTVDAAPPL